MVEYIMIAAGVIIARYVYKKKEAKIKGNSGERKLCRSLKRLKIPGKIKVMRDSLFQAEWGTSQIDALAITKYGIIVCEMKNHNGTVYGAVGESDWIVQYGDRSEPLHSPIKQNYSHVSALSSLLKEKYPRLPYLPLVVFGNEATLHIQKSRNKVCNLKDLSKVVGRQLGPEVLSDQDVEEIASFLDKNQIKGRRARRTHVAGIELKQEAKSKYSKDDMDAIKEEIFAAAKDAPVISSSGLVFSDQERFQNCGASNHINLADRIQVAESMRDTSSLSPYHNGFDNKSKHER